MKSRTFLLVASLLILAFFINQRSVIGRDAPISTIGSANPCPNGAVTLPVTVTNFTLVTAISLKIDYNPTLLTFINSTNLNTTLTGLLVNEVTVSPTLHKIIFVWSDITPATLANGAKLADLNFTYLTGTGSVAFNNTSGGGTDCEYADELGNPMNDMPTASFYFNGNITNAAVGAAGAITGLTPVCQNTNGVAYSVGAITNATGYTWTVPAGAAIATGSNSNAITVNYSGTAVSGNITVAGTNSCPAPGSPGASATLAVTLNARPTPAITGPASACVGITGVVYTTEAGMSGYAWTVSAGGTITAGQGTNSITVSWTTTGAKTVTATYTGTNSCAALTPTVKNVTINPLPVPTITGPATCGVGTTGNVYTTEAGMTNYVWTVSAGGTITAGGTSTSNTVTVTWTVTGTKTVTVTYTNANGCVPLIPTSFPVNVITLPGPAGPITGAAVACQNANGVAYSVAPIVNATGYVWTLPAGATIATGANTNSITVNFSSTAVSGTVTVYGTNTSGNGTVSPAFTVTVNPAPSPTITGTATVCAGATGVTYTTQTGMTGYSWTVSAGGAITAGSGTNVITVSWNTPGAQTVAVNYFNGTGCTAAAPTSYPVTVNPSPVPAITGNNTVCAGIGGNMYSTQTGMTNYIWTVSAGGTITAGGTTTSNTVTVTWTTTGAKTVTVNYTNASNCSAPTATVYAVTVNALPVPTITGTSTVCQGTAGLVYTTQAAMTNYIWTVSPGGTITAGGTSTSNTVTVTWTTFGAKTVTVNYTNANGCTAVAAASFPVTVNAVPVPTIGSTNSPCVGSTNNMYYTESGMTGYIWTVSSGGVIVSGQGTSTLNVTWNLLGAQTVSVNYTNPAACTAPAPTVYPVFVSSPPNPAGAITGTATVCAGANGVAYSTSPIVGVSTYIWSVPSGATIASGAGTTDITVNYSATAVSGDVTVAGTNQCGNGQSSTFAVSVNPLPAAAGTITGPATVCAGAAGVAYSVGAITNASTYVWTVPAGAVITSGGTTRNILVTFGPAAGTGVITVKGTNTCGSGTVSPSFSVTMNAIPAAPVVTVAGNVLTSSAPSGNQWYYEGTAITGATGQSYTVVNNTGYYWCVVTVNGCSSPISNKVWVVITGQQELQNSNFSIYPVPNDGKFTVSITSLVQETFTIVVYNQLGAKIYELGDVQVNGTFEKQVDLRPVANGVYTVVFLNSGHKVVRKVLVKK